MIFVNCFYFCICYDTSCTFSSWYINVEYYTDYFSYIKPVLDSCNKCPLSGCFVHFYTAKYIYKYIFLRIIDHGENWFVIYPFKYWYSSISWSSTSPIFNYSFLTSSCFLSLLSSLLYFLCIFQKSCMCFSLHWMFSFVLLNLLILWLLLT